MSSDQGPAERPSTAEVVGPAIERLMVQRLGRGFLPVGFLGAAGLGRALQVGVDATTGGLTLGAIVVAAAMLAYGMRVVQRAAGRPDRPWMAAAGVGSLVPLGYGAWILGWLGLRGLGAGGWETVVAIVYTLLGVWLLRAWLRVVEVRRLAAAMIGPTDSDGGMR